MNKQDALKLCPDAYCKQEKNGRFYIFVDHSNPVFPHGHTSSRKAWKDLVKVLVAIPNTLTKRSLFANCE